MFSAVISVTTTVIASTLPHFFRLPWWALAVIAVALSWRVGALLGHLKMPSRWARLALVATSTGTILLEFGSLLGKEPGVVLFSIMLTLKLFESSSVRDLRVVTVLCFFMMVTQFLFSQSLYLAFYLLITVLVATNSLTLLQRARFATLTQGEEADWRPREVPARLFTSTFSRRNLSLLLRTLPLALVLFVLFPRLSSPLWGLPSDAGPGRTGLADSMSPGSILQLFVDDSAAFRVTFHGRTPPESQLYWRGPVFWHFDGTTWHPNAEFGQQDALVTGTENLQTIDYEITLEPHQGHWIAGLDRPITRPDRFRLSADFQLWSPKKISATSLYSLSSVLQYQDSGPLPQRQRKIALEYPKGLNPLSERLMTEWRAEGLDDGAVLARLLNHFGSAPFAYSLEPPELSEQAVDDFFFLTRDGYCEHYASTFTAMARMAGIPARVVTGFQGAHHVPIGNYYLVRNSDAHAWSEVWLEDRGWVRVDPTAAVAPERVTHGAAAASGAGERWYESRWLLSFRDSMDSIQYLWKRWVVDYDKIRREDLLGELGISGGETARQILVVFFSTLLAIGVSVLGWMGWRTRKLHPLRAIYDRFLRKLQKRGIEICPSEGPLDLLCRLQTESPRLARNSALFLRTYAHARYGRAVTDRQWYILRQSLGRF